MKHCDWGLFALHMGDCREVLRALPDATFDSVVCDPPYGLTSGKKGGAGLASVNLESPYGRARIGTGNGPGGFMGMKWDSGVPTAETWAEVLRVLKPGGHMVAFFGTRTYHRGVVAVEDAGFEIRDQIGWAFGSGFPKSHNGPWGGTALKPAWEPIVLARKPLIGTVEANHAAHGTGGLNIDGCRVTTDPSVDDPRLGGAGAWKTDKAAKNVYEGGYAGKDIASSALGRWPANLIHDGSDEVLAAFPSAPGQAAAARNDGAAQGNNTFGALRHVTTRPEPRGDSGSAARFFYCAKASKTDRSEGNTHPTVKPTDLMRYLCRLITPAGGLVLDPFCGSGSTGKAAMLEGMRFVGVDLSAEYLKIAERRIAHAAFGDVAFGTPP